MKNKVNRIILFLGLLAIIYFLVPNTALANTVIDGNAIKEFKKTKSEILAKWNGAKIEIPEGYSIYEQEPSYEAPYKGGVVKKEFIDLVIKNANYYRYLVGSPEVPTQVANREDLQAATVLQYLSLRSGNGLTHELYYDFKKPADMTDEFYQLAAYADHNIISPYGYTNPVFSFFSESYFKTTSGHRTGIIAPTVCKLEFGLGKVTYGDVDTSRAQYDKMSNSFAAYPSPGYFPKQDFTRGSDWDIYLNANNFTSITSTDAKNITVTIKCKSTGETFVRTIDNKNLYASGFLIHMVRPDISATYYDGDWEVYVTNLKDSSGNLVDLKYTISFYDKFEGVESNIRGITYGDTTPYVYMDEECNENVVKTVLPKTATISLASGGVFNSNIEDYTFNKKDDYYYSSTYKLVPKFKNLPSYVKDENNVIQQGMGFNVYTDNNYYDYRSYKYTQANYNVKKNESVTITLANNAMGYEKYANYYWVKDKNGVVEKIENNSKYTVNGMSLTINNCTSDDEAKYYLINYTTVKNVIPFPIYISKGITVSLGTTVSGTLTSFGESEKTTKLELIPKGNTTAKYTIEVNGSGEKQYSFQSVDAGNYILRASKNNNVTREYEITVGTSEVKQDVKICLLGDVNQDGKVNGKDWNRMNEHINKTNPLTGYELLCFDVNEDGKMNAKDWNRMNEHVNKTNPLF